MKLSELSVCIIARNAQKHIQELIIQIQNGAAHAGINPDLFVVDNNSTDATSKIIQALKSVNLIYNKETGNVSLSRNLGIENARYKYLWFFDDDSIVTDEAFAIACSILEQYNPDVVMPIIINQNGIPHNCKKVFGKKIAFELPANKILRDCSSSFIINTIVARKNNAYFDEHMPFMWEDVEYFLRIKRLGLKIFYTHDVRIGHRIKTIGEKISDRMGYLFYLQTKNSIIIYKRLPRNQLCEFNDFCPGGNIFIFIIFCFLAACFNYNFWVDFYVPTVKTTGDRIISLLRPARPKLDKSFVHTLYFFFKGIIDGIMYKKRISCYPDNRI